MVIDMNEAQVRTVEQVRQVLAGTQALEFRAAEDDDGRYRWIEAVLWRLDYRLLRRADRGVVLAYLQRLSGYSRAQVTRLVSRWVAAYVILHDKTLRELAARRPASATDLLDVPGIGQAKIDRYGETLLRLLGDPIPP